MSAERDTLRSEQQVLKSERDSYRRLYLETLAQVRKLEAGVTGRGRERDLGNPNQISLSLLSMMTGGAVGPAEPEAPPATEQVRAHERAKPTGRKPLPENLPRVEIEVLPPEVQARGLDAFERIGEDVSEVVERRRASLVVVRITRPKFVEKGRDLRFEIKVPRRSRSSCRCCAA